MNIRESSFGYWTSSRAFVWVAAGATMGIGNLARLPYLMSEHGGPVFLIAYVVALGLLALPLLIAEWALGRWMREDAVSGFERLAITAGASRRWRFVGAWALVAGALTLSYYSVVAGWNLAYLFRAASGDLADGQGSAQRFLALAQDAERGFGWHTLFMVMTCIIVAQGFREGIERAASYIVPTAFIAMTALCAAALVYGDTNAAVDRLMVVDFRALGWRGVLEALLQAFYTLGLGFGAMLTLGMYLPVSAPLVRTALTVVLMDTLFSTLSGIVLFSFVLKAGMAPGQGLYLGFQAFADALPEGAPGIAIATTFYLVMVLVTLISAAALLEPATRYLMERRRLTRVFAATTAAIIIWYLGLGSLLSFGYLADLTAFGQNWFEWVQMLSTTLMAPAGGLLICLVITRLLPVELARGLWGQREQASFWPWILALRYPARLALALVVAYSLGALDWLAKLWL